MLSELVDEVLPSNEPTTDWKAGESIVIDLGSWQTKVGIASRDSPSHVFSSVSAKYRDKRAGGTTLVVGNEVWTLPNARNIMKPAHEQGILANWDVVEHILDYSFELIGVKSRGKVDSPVVLSEMLATPHLPRSTLTEILFEGYGVPKLAMLVDALAAYSINDNTNGKGSGVVVNAGHEAVSVVPVVSGKPDLTGAKRLNWGGRQGEEFMQQLLALKYPVFPTRISVAQAGQLYRSHCYVSKDFGTETSAFLDLEGLEDRERIIQVKVPQKDVKSQEELQRIAERRKESGRRLQEQAAKAREEKLAALQADLEELQKLREGSESDLHDAGFETEAELDQAIQQIEKKLTPTDQQEDEPPETPLLKVPDEELSPEDLREKRKQKLMKANYDARQHAREEKLAKQREQELHEQKEQQWRETDLQGWIKAKREALGKVRDRIRRKRQLRAQLNDRKSLASKMRMKSIALLAGAGATKKRKLKNGAEEDKFGADDDDWQIYVAEDSDDDDEQLHNLQKELLEYDPDFGVDDLGERGDWRENVVHKFLYGAHPFDHNSQQQAYQLNLNVERIRVPEVLFQPSIVGVDQAGISEILSDMLTKSYKPYQVDMAKNIVVTGGFSSFKNLDERIASDIRSELPTGTEINVHSSTEPNLDAWRGMAKWATNSPNWLTKKEYEENGTTYKANRLGNVF